MDEKAIDDVTLYYSIYIIGNIEIHHFHRNVRLFRCT